jgi:hypothetical protein
MAEVTYVGTPDDHTQTITEGGFTFTKGEAVTVPDKHPRLAKFRGNHTFVVDDEPVDLPDDEAEVTAVRAELDKLGVTYSDKAKLPSLRKKLADAANPPA